MANLCLSVGRGRNMQELAFPQQGQVDWIAFGKTIYSASFAVMQRLAAADVQPITHGAGLALACRFQMSDTGRGRMHEALDSLRMYPAFELVVSFGFGYQSFVRLLAETQIGVNCIALCSCLVDTHSEELAAWVLRELWLTEDFPKAFEPSYSQLLSLVKACAGVVAGTTFGQTVYLMLGDGRRSNVTLAKGASGAQDIAKALHGLFQVSRGTTDSITIIGGPDCAFIAALAYWLLDISIHVEDEDGVPIFTSASAQEPAQIRVQYIDVDQRSRMEIASSTYVLGDHSELMHSVEQASVFDFVARTPWEGCFTRIFGLSFQKLIGSPNLLGTFLGSAARIATALTSNEAKREGFDYTYINFVEASYGKGFLESISTLFPEFSEVRGLKAHMQLAEEVSLHKARESIERTIRSVKLICGCQGCSSKTYGGDEEASQDTHKACLVAMLATIKRLVTTLSCVEKDPLLNPTVSGIKSVYEYMYQVWAMRTKEDEDFCPTLLEIGRDDHSYLIQDVHVIFAGTYYQSIETLEQPSPHWHYCTATSQGGICIYLNVLESLSGTAELMRKIHVKRGHIEWRDRLYSSVWDAISWNNNNRQIVQCEEASSQIPLKERSWDQELVLKAFVTERSSGNRLHFYYRACLPTGESIALQPGALTETVLRNTGNLLCNKHNCGKSLAFPCSYVSGGWTLDSTITERLQFHAGVACCIWPSGNNIARCIAMQAIRDAISGWNNQIFLRRTECLPCCTLDILQQSSDLLSYTKAPEPRAVAWILT